MAVTKRYAVYCHGELIGEYTAVDAAEMLKCTPGTVRTYASGGNKLYGEYTFEVVEPEEKAVRPWPKCDDWSEEWERTRQMFLCSGLDLSRIPIRPGAGWR